MRKSNGDPGMGHAAPCTIKQNRQREREREIEVDWDSTECVGEETICLPTEMVQPNKSDII